jgi:hypothetical protein
LHDRIKGYGKGRLKRTNFVALAKGEIRKHEVLARPSAVSLTAKVPTPPWRRTELLELICDIPGIVDKQLQTLVKRKSIAVKYITIFLRHSGRMPTRMARPKMQQKIEAEVYTYN